MYQITAYKSSKYPATISQMPVKRWWMDDTYEKHAYNCFPVTLTNRLGWSLSYPEDISFVWDGISDSTPNHVKILSGDRYVDTTRSNATISFLTGISFNTDKNLSLLTMPPSNYFVDGATCFTTLISTSFFTHSLPVVYRITSPNKVITIKAGDPVCTIIPISLTELQDSEIVLKESEFRSVTAPTQSDQLKEMEVRNKILKSGKWTDFYRNATNWRGDELGEHEVKAIRLKVVEYKDET